MRLRLAVRSARVAPVPLGLNPLHWKAGEPKRITELARRLLKINNALRIRNLVNTVHTRHTLRLNPRRHALVRRQHELLDQPMRPSPLRTHDGFHVPIGIELNYRLRQIEINRSPAM